MQTQFSLIYASTAEISHSGPKWEHSFIVRYWPTSALCQWQLSTHCHQSSSKDLSLGVFDWSLKADIH